MIFSEAFLNCFISSSGPSKILVFPLDIHIGNLCMKFFTKNSKLFIFFWKTFLFFKIFCFLQSANSATKEVFCCQKIFYNGARKLKFFLHFWSIKIGSHTIFLQGIQYFGSLKNKIISIHFLKKVSKTKKFLINFKDFWNFFSAIFDQNQVQFFGFFPDFFLEPNCQISLELWEIV